MFCQYPSDNHSANKVTVYHGEATPLTLCGYHALIDLNSTLLVIKKASKTNA